MYSVYLIVNEKGSKYIGYTASLKERIRQHNAGMNKSTQGHTWTLVYAEAYLDETDARQREAQLKKHGRTKMHMYNRAEQSIKKVRDYHRR